MPPVLQSIPIGAKAFIERIVPLCSTVFLGGSWGSGEATPESDVDLCLICIDTPRKAEVLTHLRSTASESLQGRVMIDVKVFTRAEFQKVSQGIYNSYWYTFFRNGMLLHGQNVQVRLLPSQFRETVWKALEDIREAATYAEQSMLLDVVCYKLWTALSLCYTVECVTTDRPYQKKERMDFLGSFFGSLVPHLKESYESVRRMRIRQMTADSPDSEYQVLSIRPRAGRKALAGVDTTALLEAIDSALSYAEGLYARLNSYVHNGKHAPRKEGVAYL